MRTLTAILLLLSLSVQAEFKPAESWDKAKNMLDDNVYPDHRRTFYCGCEYTSDLDRDGSGDIDADACGLQDVQKYRSVRNTIQWEHVIPASLMPVSGYMCWQQEKQIPACLKDDGSVRYSNRNCCERVSPSGKLMIFDLHNLVPSAAQLNQYRTNDPYGEVADGSGFEGFGSQCEARDLGGTSQGGLFEPPDCKKGDAARIWFYMRLAHGVEIDDETNATFELWSRDDPVSPWEAERNSLVAGVQGNSNPYVDGVTPNPTGACDWE